MKEDFAIIIGINDYTPISLKGLRTLQGAINDANNVEKWVASTSGGNVPSGNIKKIISTPNPLRPFQTEIDMAFDQIIESINAKGGLARRLYFYFAGHGLGTLDSSIDTGLCPANWSEFLRHTALSSESYKDYIKQIGYFEEIFFIADCCRNTKINIKLKTPGFSSPVPGQNAGQTNMFVAYATQYQDQSFEIESVDSEMRGAFTTVLLEALEGAASKNGVIGADDLRDYLAIETPKLALKMGYKQIPDITHTFIQNASLVKVKDIQSNVNLFFSVSRNNPVELLDGNLNIIDIYNLDKTRKYSKHLEKGLYQLRDTITDETIYFKVLPSQNNIDVNF